MDEQESVDRSVISIGLDFRPIPVNVGDGTVWKFTPDPSKDQWVTLTDTLKLLSKFKDVSDSEAENIDLTAAIDSLTNAMSSLLSSETESKAWKKRGYGLLAQQQVARVVLEQWTGFPTTSPSPSGKKSKPTG